MDQTQCDQIGRFIELWATFIDIWRLFTGHTDQTDEKDLGSKTTNIAAKNKNYEGSLPFYK